MALRSRSQRVGAMGFVGGFLFTAASCTAATVPAKADLVEDPMLANARSKAELRGSARLVVTVAASSGTAGNLQAEAIKEALIQRLGTDVVSSRSILGTPYLVVELKPGGIAKLGRERAVADVHDDAIESPQ